MWCTICVISNLNSELGSPLVCVVTENMPRYCHPLEEHNRAQLTRVHLLDGTNLFRTKISRKETLHCCLRGRASYFYNNVVTLQISHWSSVKITKLDVCTKASTTYNLKCKTGEGLKIGNLTPSQSPVLC